MARVKLKFPDNKALFEASIPVRISEINYGNHLGNDSVLSIMHESRMQWLRKNGYNELDIGGVGLIMADVMIAYKAEAFYGDVLSVKIYADEVTDRSFDLMYHISAIRNGAQKDVAHAKTGMVCYDYKERKIAIISEALKSCLFD